MKQDVAVIGGSAAGLLTAALLAEQGLEVNVFESSKSLIAQPRTLIVTHEISKLIGSLNENTVLNKIHRYELFANGRVAKISLSKPDLVIERTNLLRELADRVKEKGAKIYTNHRFLDFEPNGTHLKFRVTNNGYANAKNVLTQTLIGADGAFSTVAKLGGWPRKHTIPLIQAVVKLPSDMSSDTSRVWFLPEDTPYFYWLIPHSSSEGVLGLIAKDMQKGRQSLDRFMKRKGLKPYSFQSAPTPIYNRWIPIHRRIGSGDVYLVGDAAGHVKVSTVGGVVTGLRGAKGVAEAILDGGHSAELSSIRRDLFLHWLIRRSLNGFSEVDYTSLLDMLNPASTRLLSVYNRDEAINLLLHLFFRQPRLLMLGLRTIF